jgi:hypothetical protein
VGEVGVERREACPARFRAPPGLSDYQWLAGLAAANPKRMNASVRWAMFKCKGKGPVFHRGKVPSGGSVIIGVENDWTGRGYDGYQMCYPG